MRFFYRFFCGNINPSISSSCLSNPIDQTNLSGIGLRIDFLVLSHQDFEYLNYDAQLLTPDLQDGDSEDPGYKGRKFHPYKWPKRVIGFPQVNDTSTSGVMDHLLVTGIYRGPSCTSFDRRFWVFSRIFQRQKTTDHKWCGLNCHFAHHAAFSWGSWRWNQICCEQFCRKRFCFGCLPFCSCFFRQGGCQQNASKYMLIGHVLQRQTKKSEQLSPQGSGQLFYWVACFFCLHEMLPCKRPHCRC